MEREVEGVKMEMDAVGVEGVGCGRGGGQGSPRELRARDDDDWPLAHRIVGDRIVGVGQQPARGGEVRRRVLQLQ